jgi:hypothetical protein
VREDHHVLPGPAAPSIHAHTAHVHHSRQRARPPPHKGPKVVTTKATT